MKAVFFDGYGTLFEGGMDGLTGTCGKIAADYGLGMTGEELLSAWDRHYFDLIRGEAFVSLRDAHYQTLPIVFRALGRDAPSMHYVDELIDFLGSLPVFEDVRPALASLASRFVGVISNADEDHLHAALERNGLSFPIVVSSESARCYKPHPGIFHHTLERTGHRPEEAVYVGDDPEDDIVGARAAGLSVVWLNREGKPRVNGIPDPDAEIRSLNELPGILDDLG